MEVVEVVAEPTPEEVEAAKREQWIAGSIPQLRRFWSGRCLTCQNWGGYDKPDKGVCRAITETVDQIEIVNLTSGYAITAAAFGCILWSEITPEMTEVVVEHKGLVEIRQKELDGPIRARTEKAIALGLMDDAPGAPE